MLDGALARRLRLVGLDVDGVLTDGGLYIGSGAAGQRIELECAFVGDDIADLPLLTRAALPVAVANAVPEVKAVARFVTSAPGGRGAVREIAESLLKARGVWTDVLQEYLSERGNVQTRTG